MAGRVAAISLGQGQGSKAAALIAEGVAVGSWVVLQVGVVACALACCVVGSGVRGLKAAALIAEGVAAGSWIVLQGGGAVLFALRRVLAVCCC